MELSRLAAALEGNAALQRRARLAALCFTVLEGDKATAVRVGRRASPSDRCQKLNLVSRRSNPSRFISGFT